MRSLVILPLLLLVTACAGANYDYKHYLAKKGVTQLTPEHFEHCRGYGCRIIDDNITLSDNDREKARLIFTQPIKDAAEERRRIAKAIGFFEDVVGAHTGTKADRAGTYLKLGDNQHDCVDESVNTTIYLSLLEQDELLLYHGIATPSSRVPPFSRGLGPHQTAVIIEKETGMRYAVDSWFHDNGYPAEIVAMDEWFFGWRPKNE